MTIGEKIKRIRTFRGMTQKELGSALGLGEKGDNRIAQYETNYRVPKKELIEKMTKVLDVNQWALLDLDLGDTASIMETLFWMEEQTRGCIQLFEMRRNDEPHDYETNKLVVEYREVEGQHVLNPTGLIFNGRLLNNMVEEWRIRQEELRNNQITRDEYFEWKLNWPATCDSCGQFEPQKQWRKTKQA